MIFNYVLIKLKLWCCFTRLSRIRLWPAGVKLIRIDTSVTSPAGVQFSRLHNVFTIAGRERALILTIISNGYFIFVRGISWLIFGLDQLISTFCGLNSSISTYILQEKSRLQIYFSIKSVIVSARFSKWDKVTIFISFLK